MSEIDHGDAAEYEAAGSENNGATHECDTLLGDRGCSVCADREAIIGDTPNWRLCQELRQRADWAQSTVRRGGIVYVFVFDRPADDAPSGANEADR